MRINKVNSKYLMVEFTELLTILCSKNNTVAQNIISSIINNEKINGEYISEAALINRSEEAKELIENYTILSRGKFEEKDLYKVTKKDLSNSLQYSIVNNNENMSKKLTQMIKEFYDGTYSEYEEKYGEDVISFIESHAYYDISIDTDNFDKKDTNILLYENGEITELKVEKEESKTLRKVFASEK